MAVPGTRPTNPLRMSTVSAIRSTAEAVGHVGEQAVAAEVDEVDGASQGIEVP
jgi:hypothetical protein